MNFLELAKRRFSVRQFEPKKIEEDKLLKILEAGRVAPTAANYNLNASLLCRVTLGGPN